MVITYLIGNGFDLNLGLHTSFNDFVKVYSDSPTNPSKYDEVISGFKSYIKQDISHWGNAELAIGKYTDAFSSAKKGVDNYLACHSDFCHELGKYLEDQESRINYNNSQLGQRFISAISRYTYGFRDVSRAQIKDCTDAAGGGITYNFIVYNYTHTVDRLFSLAMGHGLHSARFHNGTRYQNAFGRLYHVHGYTDHDMVLGVNDESQLANPNLFSNANDEDIGQIIKILTNALNEDRTDEIVHEVIENSDLIYIYGMSIGPTDKIWWQRICTHMKNNENVCVILSKCHTKEDPLLRRGTIQHDREARNAFLQYSDVDSQTANALSKRIFITHGDIFGTVAETIGRDLAPDNYNSVAAIS